MALEKGRAMLEIYPDDQEWVKALKRRRNKIESQNAKARSHDLMNDEEVIHRLFLIDRHVVNAIHLAQSKKVNGPEFTDELEKMAKLLGEIMNQRDDALMAKPFGIDDIITMITEEDTDEDALSVIRTIRTRKLLDQIADQLHIDSEGHDAEWIRKAIVKEART